MGDLIQIGSRGTVCVLRVLRTLVRFLGCIHVQKFGILVVFFF